MTLLANFISYKHVLYQLYIFTIRFMTINLLIDIQLSIIIISKNNPTFPAQCPIKILPSNKVHSHKQNDKNKENNITF
jgi:hypothetical protein